MVSKVKFISFKKIPEKSQEMEEGVYLSRHT
jgi:hypothetical protein